MKTKDIILKALADKKGKFISGEELSTILGITRTAVWKHIARLKEDGYSIHAVSNRGYRLEAAPDVFGKGSVFSQLHTKLLGRELVFLEEADSTNDEMKRLVANGAEEGTVVLAEKQISGRGRRGRTWASQTGKGIYMSILIKPDIAPGEVQAITLAASSAVCKAIEPYTLTRPGIKWPNDILLQNKKVCGILTEMTAEPDRIHSIIVGIGLNVYHSEADFPGALQETATSLMLNSKVDISRSRLIAQILEQFEDLYLDFIQKRSTAKFLNIWRCFSITIGYDILVYQNGEPWQAKALDVLDDGRLLVETRDGRRQAISSGEISIRVQ